MTELRHNLEVHQEIIDAYFRDVHSDVIDLEVLEKLEETYNIDKLSFCVCIFAMISKLGKENPEFAIKMLGTWL